MENIESNVVIDNSATETIEKKCFGKERTNNVPETDKVEKKSFTGKQETDRPDDIDSLDTENVPTKMDMDEVSNKKRDSLSGSKRKVPSPASTPSYARATQSSQVKRCVIQEEREKKKQEHAKMKAFIEKKNLKLTSPVAVNLHTESIKQHHVESSEEAAIRRLKEERKRAEDEMNRINEFYEETKHNSGAMYGGRVYATTALTVPQSPNLTAQMRPKAVKKKSDNCAEMVKKPTKKTVSAPVELTEPKPFTFSTTQRAGRRSSVIEAAAVQKFRSAAEKVRDFQCNTPKRFHTKPANSGPDLTNCEINAGSQPLTEPEGFDLRTSRIQRKTNVKSSQELEEEYIRKNGRFRARPLNTRVMQSAGDLGVPKIDKRPPTIPQGF
eukprot:g2647.t1